MSKQDYIVVRGAREHNLKNLSLEIPRNKITVVTGLSGSGKSSLAFDTIFAEGQRRYLDSLSTYARQFVDRLKRPDIDSLVGLSPAIAIDQKTVGLNPRSTVGTVTEIYDFLRLLYAKVGTPHCPTHKIPVHSLLPEQIVSEVMSLPPATKVLILAPMAEGKKGEFHNEFQQWISKGFLQARIDGKVLDLEKAGKLTKTKAHDIDLVVDKVVIKSEARLRISESIHSALQLASGQIVVETLNGQRIGYSIHSSCPKCKFSFPPLDPKLFSFNSPRGACKQCNGLGTLDIQEEQSSEYSSDSESKRQQTRLIISNKIKSTNEDGDEQIDQLAIEVCPTCHGSRLDVVPQNVLISGMNISDLAKLNADELLIRLDKLETATNRNVVSEKISREIKSRLTYLSRVGAGYLAIDRPTRTLSGGEAQRIRLASQLGSSLVGILYVLDEPSIGLHPRDHARLLSIIDEIRTLGNTILMVEHDEDTIRNADYVLDMGPRAGRLGGQLVASGSPLEISQNLSSPTGAFLSGRSQISVNTQKRKPTMDRLELSGASGNNLKSVDLSIPLRTFVAVTGVSGSGKSTLIMDTLYRALANHFLKSNFTTAPFNKISGLQHLDKVIDINQNPIGRTPRSTPSTYVGLFPLIRDLFAQLNESKIRGYGPGRFSFNVKGGRCETCQGAGQIKVEMHFMADTFVKCDVCNGRRYNKETLAVKFKDKNIAEVLEMSVSEAIPFFKNHNKISRKLETLNCVGLDYISLGQSSTTLSGGEAQRVKLSKELSKRGTGNTFYILDEPTTGLHFSDIQKLLELLHSLVDQGNTVLVIEHNMDVVKTADHVIDIGPEGGALGGSIVAQGTPEQICKNPCSITAKYLAEAMKERSIK